MERMENKMTAENKLNELEAIVQYLSEKLSETREDNEQLRRVVNRFIDHFDKHHHGLLLHDERIAGCTTDPDIFDEYA